MNALFKYFKTLTKAEDGSVINLIKQSDVALQGNRLRFLPMLIWLQAEREILESRIKKRLQTMVNDKQEGGMTGLEEATFVLDQFVGNYDFSKGILQAIGYKEFFEFYSQTTSQDQREQQLAQAVDKLCAKTL